MIKNIGHYISIVYIMLVSSNLGLTFRFCTFAAVFNIRIMYSSEDLDIKCKSNTMNLAFVEMQPLLYTMILLSVQDGGIAPWRIYLQYTFMCNML